MEALKKKVIVAMSGGVDSSVAAALLARQGYDVAGVTLRLLPKGGQGFGCCGSPDDITIAKRSAEKAGVPHYVLDYSADFEKDVIDYFVDSYLEGETPNPCLACNKHIKFNKLKKFAHSLEASFLATGHYARILKKGYTYHLYEAIDPAKDQSYVLYDANQESLAFTLFPIGNRPKTEIRALAQEFKLPNWDKKDSQEICFVPNRDYAAFVNQQVQEKKKISPTTFPGPIKDETGAVVGQHKGAAYYTIGQRKGLGLTTTKPVYVNKIDAAANTVYIGSAAQNVSRGLLASDPSWTSDKQPKEPFHAWVKIRYKHEPAEALVTPEENQFRVEFLTPQRAVSPGQAAVLYRWDDDIQAREVLGGGKISAAIK